MLTEKEKFISLLSNSVVKPSDAIILLEGDGMYRIEHACNLYNQGYSSYFVFSGNAYNLNYGSEINSYTLTDYGGLNNSLFQKFYQNYILRVFNTKTRIFKFKAVLPLKFLLTYSLADKVFIDGRAFTINKINTNLQTGKSTLELLNEPT